MAARPIVLELGGMELVRLYKALQTERWFMMTRLSRECPSTQRRLLKQIELNEALQEKVDDAFETYEARCLPLQG